MTKKVTTPAATEQQKTCSVRIPPALAKFKSQHWRRRKIRRVPKKRDYQLNGGFKDISADDSILSVWRKLFLTRNMHDHIHRHTNFLLVGREKEISYRVSTVRSEAYCTMILSYLNAGN